MLAGFVSGAEFPSIIVNAMSITSSTARLSDDLYGAATQSIIEMKYQAQNWMNNVSDCLSVVRCTQSTQTAPGTQELAFNYIARCTRIDSILSCIYLTIPFIYIVVCT